VNDSDRPDGDRPDSERPDDQRPDGERALDAELRRLFADDRLSLPVALDADRVIVAGVRRRRRRRLAVASAGGVLAVAAVVSTAVGLTGLGRAPSTISAATAVPTITLTTSSAPPSTTPVRPGVLGPFGVGTLRLGMSLDELKPILRKASPTTDKATGCVSYTAVVVMPVDPPGSVAASRQRTAAGVPEVQPVPLPVQVVVSATEGVVQINGPGLRTPEGIGTGSPAGVVFRTYQVAQQRTDGAVVVPVPENPRATYVFLLAGAYVKQLSLRSATAPPC
jgi:hypothetical protein